jgi:hypothetical protein
MNEKNVAVWDLCIVDISCNDRTMLISCVFFSLISFLSLSLSLSLSQSDINLSNMVLELLLLPCTRMMNNVELKRERARENQDTDLRDSAICLRPKECGYIQ